MNRSSVALAILAMSASAGHSEDYYKGRIVNIVVGYAPGGGYDNYARLLSRHLGKHVVGRPSIVVQNMPGAASLVAANYTYNVAPKDGTVIAAVDQNIGLFQMLGGSGIQYDLSKVAWLGSLSVSNGVLATWHASGLKNLADLKTKEVVAGSTGPKDDTALYGRILNEIIGTRIKIVQGYNGTAAVSLAIERGEVEAVGRTYYGFLSQKPDWIRDKMITFQVQFGYRRQAELPDVPLLTELASSEAARQIAEIVSLPTGIGYAHWVAPEAPSARLELLRLAYTAAIKDPELLADAKKMGAILSPRTPAELATVVASAANIPVGVRQKVGSILQWD